MLLPIFLIGLLGSAPAARGAESCLGSPPTLSRALACAEERAPELKAATLSLAQARARRGALAERRNPELGVESFHGSVAGSSQAETNFVLGVPLELGGKRAARLAVGEGSVAQGEAALYQARAELRAKLLLSLHRYRQALHEKEVVEESIGSFGKLLGQYQSRASLSPEQETSAAVYRMARSEYELKKAELSDELAELDAFFLLYLGDKGEELRGILPASPGAWPIVAAGPQGGSQASPAVRAFQAGRQSAEAELALARSEAWPTVVVGPSIRLQSQGSASGTLYGFNLGLPLPLFQAGGRAKEAAAAGVAASESAEAEGRRLEARAREVNAGIYERSTSLLKTTLSHREIERAHGDIERLFARGVVPSALVIEAHRSYFELERARNEREKKALSALFALYTIDGLILEKSL